MNSIGQRYRLTTFGESHGPALGGIIDGMPAGFAIDLDAVQRQLDRRRPGQSDITTSRSESDTVEVLSGIFEGRTTGTPIGFIIRNSNARSADYSEMARLLRPNHADYTYQARYGIRDYRGGGRASARETAARVVAGAFAAQYLAAMGITVTAYTDTVGDIAVGRPYTDLDLTAVDSNAVRCPDGDTARRMEELIRSVKADGDTIGGIVRCVVRGVPAGIGNPIFGKLQALLAAAMLSIPAAHGFDYGDGFSGVALRGSQALDPLPPADGSPNHSGGIQGGISNGADITFRVLFKPVATLLRPVPTIDIDGNAATLTARGRHDPCVLPRAVPVVEAMAAITILDTILQSR